MNPRLGFLVSVLILTCLVSGCWDHREIDSLLIVTGIALDASDGDPRAMDMSFQIGMPSHGARSREEGGSDEKKPSVVMETTADSVMQGLADLSRQSSRTLLLDHNQVLLFGEELAQKGIEDRLDFFIRNQFTRMETPVVVVLGRAGEALKVEFPEEPISGGAIALAIDTRKTMSQFYQVRVIDLVLKLIVPTCSPVIPIVMLSEKDGKKQVEMSGMAIFRDDKMIGHLTEEETAAYTFVMGTVFGGQFSTSHDAGEAVFAVSRLIPKRKVKLGQDGNVEVRLALDAVLSVAELRGFVDYSAKDLMPMLMDMAGDKIRENVIKTFEVTRELGTDIFDFGKTLRQTDRVSWKQLNDHWDEVYPHIQLFVEVIVRIPDIGEVAHSLQMKER